MWFLRRFIPLVTTALIKTPVFEHHTVVRVYSTWYLCMYMDILTLSRHLQPGLQHLKWLTLILSSCLHVGIHNTVAISLNSVSPLYFVVNMFMTFDVYTPASVNCFLVWCDVLKADIFAPYFERNLVSPYTYFLDLCDPLSVSQSFCKNTRSLSVTKQVRMCNIE